MSFGKFPGFPRSKVNQAPSAPAVEKVPELQATVAVSDGVESEPVAPATPERVEDPTLKQDLANLQFEMRDKPRSPDEVNALVARVQSLDEKTQKSLAKDIGREWMGKGFRTQEAFLGGLEGTAFASEFTGEQNRAWIESNIGSAFTSVEANGALAENVKTPLAALDAEAQAAMAQKIFDRYLNPQKSRQPGAPRLSRDTAVPRLYGVIQSTRDLPFGQKMRELAHGIGFTNF